ncbi:MAG: F0F1 ATP synthase subunit A [Alphaproteobacteria bacterium]|nr:F0F1 ATP synthase subunit A [Rickettsiales bacterium]
MHLDPLHQFKIKELFRVNLFGLEISVNNSVASMVVTTLFAIALLLFSTRKIKVKNISKLQAFVEMLFNLSVGPFESAMGQKIDKNYKPYSKYIFTIFSMILFLNLQSMIPTSFAATGQFAVTLAAGLTVMLVTLIMMFKKHGFKLFGSFIPAGTPIWMTPLMFILELISFLIRPISLCIRLGANMIAGHVMMEVLAVLVVSGGFLYGPFAFVLMVAIDMMEFGVVCLQAYIFASLSSVYISQAAHH